MNKRDILIGLGIALVLAFALSPFASSWPDGLERVAEDAGFLGKGDVAAPISSPMPDYAWPGVNNEKLATASAGVLGTLVVFGAGWGLAGLIKKKGRA